MEGNIADVKDSVLVVLYHTIDPVARVSIGVAEDTLIDGRFRFEVPVGDGSDRYNITFFDRDFSTDGVTLYGEPGKTAQVTGQGYICTKYKVKSTVRNQKEWNYFQNLIKDDIVESLGVKSSSTLSAEEKKVLRDSILRVEYLKQISALGKRDVSDVWMRVFYDCAEYYSLTGDNSLKNSLMPMFERLSEFLGKTVLREFSQIGCGPYEESKGEIREICREHSDNIVALYVNINKYDAWVPLPHIEEKDVTNFLELNDDEGMYGTFARLGMGGTPTFVLLDEDFVVKDVWVGYTEGSILERI